MLVMIALRFPDVSLLPVVWLVFSAIPYYILYCRDLIACGYEWWDLPRMYGLNLLLIPVNLAGMLKSLQQGITGRQWAFVRTPKVPGHTAAPPSYILVPIIIQMAILASTMRALADGGWASAAYGITNAVCLGYAIFWYIGLEAGFKDITLAVASRLGHSSGGFAGSASQAQRIAANEV